MDRLGCLRPKRLIGWLYWWGVWSALSVLLAMGVDLTLRWTWPEAPWWLEAALLGGVTLPLLGMGWYFFLRRTAARERALLRWHHPQRGPVSPAEFIPVAKGGGG
ncbi:MAG: hypothetical protein ACK4GB_07710 [Tepidimonas sp.]